MDIEAWESTIEDALGQSNVAYHPQYSTIALVSPRPREAKGLGADMMIAMEREFWRRVCVQETFGDVHRVASQFGRSLEDNYGVRDGPFLDLANTYWTFKLEMDDIMPEYNDTWLGQALMAVELNISNLFFPTPGPAALPKRLRKREQKKYLEHIAPEFEIDRFLSENPMLKGWFG